MEFHETQVDEISWNISCNFMEFHEIFYEIFHEISWNFMEFQEIS
jgi:hypothetical protein